MQQENKRIKYVVRKGSEVVIATESKDKALTMQFLSGGKITKEEVSYIKSSQIKQNQCL